MQRVVPDTAMVAPSSSSDQLFMTIDNRVREFGSFGGASGGIYYQGGAGGRVGDGVAKNLS